MALLLKNLLFTIVVPGAVAVYIPLAIVSGNGMTTVVPLLASGVALIALGGTIYGWCVWDFASFGQGTPLPIDAPKRLVMRGLYRVTRNPMYLGVIAIVLGWAALFADGRLIGYSFLVAAGCHAFVVLYEERRLRALFGAEYDTYCKVVGRWIPSFLGRPRA